MEIFFGNIPVNMSADALRKFVGDVGIQSDYQIVKKRGYEGVLHYGYASVGPDNVARRMIKRFDGMELNGRILSVHPFVHRTCANERRALDWRTRAWHGTERRANERRGRGAGYQAA